MAELMISLITKGSHACEVYIGALAAANCDVSFRDSPFSKQIPRM
jgi:hypothetical protein